MIQKLLHKDTAWLRVKLKNGVLNIAGTDKNRHRNHASNSLFTCCGRGWWGEKMIYIVEIFFNHLMVYYVRLGHSVLNRKHSLFSKSPTRRKGSSSTSLSAILLYVLFKNTQSDAVMWRGFWTNTHTRGFHGLWGLS